MPYDRRIAALALAGSASSRAVGRWTRCVAGLLALGLGVAVGAQPVLPLPDEDRYGIVREAPVHLDEGFLKHLAKARPGDRFEFPLFDGDTLVAATRRVEVHDEGFDWVGKVVAPELEKSKFGKLTAEKAKGIGLKDRKPRAAKHEVGKPGGRKDEPAPRETDVGDVMLSVVDGALVGTIWLEDATYSIRRGESGYVVAEVDVAAFAPTHDHAGADESDDRTVALERLENRRVFTQMLTRQARYRDLHARLVRAVEAGQLSDRVLTWLPESGARVDVMLFTTTAATAWLEDRGHELPAALDNIVLKANTAFTESGIATQLKLVVKGSVNYDEAGDETLRDDRANLRNAHPDLQLLHDLRDLMRADIVTLLVRYPPSATRNCGRAIRLAGPAQAADLVPDASGEGPFESVGFNVVNVDCAVLAHSYTHEVGHTFGAAHDNYTFQHDVAAGLAENPPRHVTPAIPGGHGFVLIEPNVRTVMAYADACVELLGQDPNGNPCPIIPRFSNALQTYQGAALGIPVGVFFGAADNAAVINLTAQTVANFRHAHVP